MPHPSENQPAPITEVAQISAEQLKDLKEGIRALERRLSTLKTQLIKGTDNMEMLRTEKTISFGTVHAYYLEHKKDKLELLKNLIVLALREWSSAEGQVVVSLQGRALENTALFTTITEGIINCYFDRLAEVINLVLKHLGIEIHCQTILDTNPKDCKAAFSAIPLQPSSNSADQDLGASGRRAPPQRLQSESKALEIESLSKKNISVELVNLYASVRSDLLKALEKFILSTRNTSSLSEAQKDDIFMLQKYVYCLASGQEVPVGLSKDFDNLVAKQNSCSCKKILAYALKFLIIASVTATLIGAAILALEYVVPEFLNLIAQMFSSTSSSITESLYNAASVVKDFGLEVIQEVGLESLITTTVSAAAIGFFSKLGLNVLQADTVIMEGAVKSAGELWAAKLTVSASA